MSHRDVESQSPLFCCGKLFFADLIKGCVVMECSACAARWERVRGESGVSRFQRQRVPTKASVSRSSAGRTPLSTLSNS